MGLLDDLKNQAEAVKQQESARNQRLQANAADIDSALRKVFQYLHELFKQLNVLKPAYPRDYDLTSVGKIDGLAQSEFRVEYRTIRRENAEHFENLEVTFRRSKSGTLTVKREAEQIERFRDLLWQNNLRFTSEPLRNERRVVVSETFAITTDIVCNAEVSGDYETGVIRFKLKNIEGFGSTLYHLEPDKLTDVALDEFAKLLLGQDSAFASYNRRTSSFALPPGERTGTRIPVYAPDPAPENEDAAAQRAGLLGSIKSIFKKS